MPVQRGRETAFLGQISADCKPGGQARDPNPAERRIAPGVAAFSNAWEAAHHTAFWKTGSRVTATVNPSLHESGITAAALQDASTHSLNGLRRRRSED